MKRIIFCFDGTWNKLDAPHPTNVVLTAQSVLPNITKDENTTAQIIHYDEGVGTTKGEQLRGGGMGYGLTKNLSEAYRFLIFNYAPGDEIYIFGFSRGAFTARSFTGLIRNCGILARSQAARANEVIKIYRSRAKNDHPDSDKLNEFRYKYGQHICVSEDEDTWRVKNLNGYNAGDDPLLKIKYLGIWDTVGALGIPKSIWRAEWFNRNLQFHDTKLTSIVESARHAVAIDERRNSFEPSLWDNFKILNKKSGSKPDDNNAPYQQVWFPGTHGSVGGGGIRRGLSDQAMDWVLDGARAQGLVLDSSPTSVIFGLRPDHREYLSNYIPPKNKFSIEWVKHAAMSALPKSDRKNGPKSMHEISASVQRRWHEDAENLKDKTQYRPPTLQKVSGKLKKSLKIDVCDYDDKSFVVHVVKRGETLSKIAKHYYGDTKRWRDIFTINAYKIDDPDRIYVGMSLIIQTDS